MYRTVIFEPSDTFIRGLAELVDFMLAAVMEVKLK